MSAGRKCESVVGWNKVKTEFITFAPSSLTFILTNGLLRKLQKKKNFCSHSLTSLKVY